MTKMDSATWAIVVAFVLYGLLTMFANYGGWNWVIAGAIAGIVAWLSTGMKK